MDPTVTAENQAYITSVYNNSYQYFNPAERGLIVKATNSTFAGLTGDASGQTIVWEEKEGVEQWVVKPLSQAAGGFNYVNQSYSGIIFNNSGTYYSVDMSNSAEVVNAVKWNSTTSSVELVELHDLATLDVDTSFAAMEDGKSYVIKKTTSTSGEGDEAVTTVTYALEAIPVLPGSSGDLGKLYMGGATSTSFEIATPENLFGLTQEGNHLVVASPTDEDSKWSAISLPDPATTGTDYYHLSVDNTGAYSYVKVVDSLSANGINLSAAAAIVSDDKAITTNAWDLTTSDPQFTAGLNYLYDVTFDIYVDDIIALVAGGLTGRALIDKLPLITIKVGTEILGKYRVKPNQPIQTVHVNHVVPDLTATPQVTVECAFEAGYPDSGSQNDIIQYIAGSLIATMTPAGSGAPTPSP